MDDDWTSGLVSRSLMTQDEVRELQGHLSKLGSHRVMVLPPGSKWQAAGPHGPGGPIVPCSYCKALVASDQAKCRNCGAPADRNTR